MKWIFKIISNRIIYALMLKVRPLQRKNNYKNNCWKIKKFLPRCKLKILKNQMATNAKMHKYWAILLFCKIIKTKMIKQRK
jgi:hypothetical protein